MKKKTLKEGSSILVFYKERIYNLSIVRIQEDWVKCRIIDPRSPRFNTKVRWEPKSLLLQKLPILDNLQHIKL